MIYFYLNNVWGFCQLVYIKEQFLDDWKKFHLGLVITMLIVQLTLWFVIKDNVFSLITSLLGIIYVAQVARGKSSNYLLGLLSSGLVFYLAFTHNLYGDSLVQAGFFIMNIFGLINYSKQNVTSVTNVTILSKDRLIKLFLGGLVVWVVGIFILDTLGDPRPIVDGLTFAIGMLAMYSLGIRYKYNFAFWIASNSIQISLWALTFYHTGKGGTLGIMYIMFLINSIYGLYLWINIEREKRLQ